MLESKKHLTRLPDPSYYDVDNMQKEASDSFCSGMKYIGRIPLIWTRSSYSTAILMWTYCSMHAGNLENCSWTSPVPITPSIPLIISLLPHYAWEPSMLNYYPKNGWYCTRRMHGTSACTEYGTSNVHGSRPENCMEMHPSKSIWGMVAGHKWTGRRLSPTGLSSLP